MSCRVLVAMTYRTLWLQLQFLRHRLAQNARQHKLHGPRSMHEAMPRSYGSSHLESFGCVDSALVGTAALSLLCLSVCSIAIPSELYPMSVCVCACVQGGPFREQLSPSRLLVWRQWHTYVSSMKCVSCGMALRSSAKHYATLPFFNALFGGLLHLHSGRLYCGVCVPSMLASSRVCLIGCIP